MKRSDKQQLSPLEISRAADHEAGHAVIAAHLHLPFHDAAIYVRPRTNRYSGEVRGVPGSFKFRAYAEHRDENGEPILVKVDPERKHRQIAERLIVMSWAGRAAAEMIATEIIPAVSSSGDEKQIKVVQKRARISDARVAELRRRAERLVRLPYVREAIMEVSAVLFCKKTVPARDVRNIYRQHKHLAPIYRLI